MKKTVLYIEYEEIFRLIVADFLETEDFQVISAGGGYSGVQLAKTLKPNLIICDLNLPKLHGLCVLKELREDLTTAKIPFIVLTAEEHSESYSSRHKC